MTESPSPETSRSGHASSTETTAPRSGSARFGAARKVAAVLGLLVGGYATAVAAARIIDMARYDGFRFINPFGSVAADTVWLNLLLLATFAIGLLLLLVAALALLTRSCRLAMALAVVAALGLLLWLAHHVLLVVVLLDQNIGIGSILTDFVFRLPTSDVAQASGLNWPYDDGSRLLMGPAFLLIALLAMVRGSAEHAEADTVADDAPPAPAPDGNLPPHDPTPVPVMYVLKIEGAEYGPYSIDRLRAFAAEGRIHRESQVRSTDGGFTAAGDVPGLFE